MPSPLRSWLGCNDVWYFLMKRILIATSLSLLLAIWMQHHLTDYRSASLFRCDAAQKSTFTPPYVPLVDSLIFTERLEVYIGGWIERGTLEIEGDAVDGAIEFIAGSRPTRISYARMGEWYQPDFTLSFIPTADASCAVRVVYRFGGVF